MRKILLLLALLGLTGTAEAQYTGALGSTWNNPGSALISQMILNGMNRQALEKQLQKTSVSQAGAQSYKYPLSRTDFTFKGKPSQQQSCAAMTNDPADQQQLADLCLNIYGQIEAQPGFRRHNLAAGLTLLLGSSWQVSEGKEFTDDRFGALERTLNDQLTGGGAMQRLSPRDIQQLYESSVMIGGLILALNEQDDPASRDLAQALAQLTLKSFGLKK